MNTQSTKLIFVDCLVETLESFGECPAIQIDGKVISYIDLAADVAHANVTLSQKLKVGSRVGVLAQRSYLSIVTILASVASGMTYVPLNPKFPTSRLKKVVVLSECAVIVVDDVLAALAQDLCSGTSGCQAIGLDKLLADTTNSHTSARAQITPETSAYIIFTSGTTGDPKGVPVSRSNLQQYLESIRLIAPVDQRDICTHNFDLSFDVSVHDIFHTLVSGACLCIPSDNDLIDPVGFAERQNVTAWTSVPSVILFAQRIRRLKPGSLPHMRLSIFAGEALPTSACEVWKLAAPNSKIFNMFGPTEATIVITSFEFNEATNDAVVPIGKALPNSMVEIADANFQLAVQGEIFLGGGQVTGGYLNDPAKTAERFVKAPALGPGTWYRTGDLGRRDEQGQIHFMGRLDEQVKVNGYRIELLEVEAVLRKASGHQSVAVVLHKDSKTHLESLIGFVSAETLDQDLVLRECRKELPVYACPRSLVLIEDLPVNANGKIDRKALLTKLTNTS
jgi:D-alanine--poly(phosphoribitol) ligase subunit 1